MLRRAKRPRVRRLDAVAGPAEGKSRGPGGDPVLPTLMVGVLFENFIFAPTPPVR